MERGGRRKLTEPRQELGHRGERDDQLGDVPRPMERLDGDIELGQRRVGLSRRRVEPGGVPGQEAAEEVDPAFADHREPLLPGRQGAGRVNIGQRDARDPQGVREPERVRHLASRGDRAVDEPERLVQPTGGLEPVHQVVIAEDT